MESEGASWDNFFVAFCVWQEKDTCIIVLKLAIFLLPAALTGLEEIFVSNAF